MSKTLLFNFAPKSTNNSLINRTNNNSIINYNNSSNTNNNSNSTVDKGHHRKMLSL